MNNNIYVNDNNVIYNFDVIFDEEKFKSIIDAIDIWYGKGDLKSFIGRICPELPGKKTEVFAEIELDEENKEYFYYHYIQHPLARTAERLLNSKDVLESSSLINILLTWNYENEDEKDFVKQLLSCFRFKQMNLGEAVLLDITEDDKRGLLERICDAINNKKREKEVVASGIDFKMYLDDEFERRFDKFISFYGETTDSYVAYQSSEVFDKNKVYRRIVKSLPNKIDLTK